MNISKTEVSNYRYFSKENVILFRNVAYYVMQKWKALEVINNKAAAFNFPLPENDLWKKENAPNVQVVHLVCLTTNNASHVKGQSTFQNKFSSSKLLKTNLL